MDATRDDSKYLVNYDLNQGYDDEEKERKQEQEDEKTNGNDNQYDDDVNLQRHPKKRKLKILLSSYESAPPLLPSTSVRKASFGERYKNTDWTKHESFVLLEAWGDRFLQCGRKSLKSEEWQEVAVKVSQVNKKRTDSQCKNRVDTLKKRYKKEKANLENGQGINSKWVYFKKMDMLLSSNSQVDSVENALTNPICNRNSLNGVDEMRGSSVNSDCANSIKVLADSINKFSEIYEKIENNKIQQMIELEKMRMDFHRDLELQNRQILERVQAETKTTRL